jgi:hypothetical protein
MTSVLSLMGLTISAPDRPNANAPLFSDFTLPGCGPLSSPMVSVTALNPRGSTPL